MERKEFFIESRFDSLPISVLEMLPEGELRAVVYLVHGLCGRKERFLALMEYLVGCGIACIASDHRGHGCSIRSEEDRGFMYNGGAKAVVMDMDAVVDYIRGRFCNVPLVMLGHSMGSLAARAYAKVNDSRLDALIVCGSPAPNHFIQIGKFLIRKLSGKDGGRMRPAYLQKITSGRYNKKFRQEGTQAWTCSDPEVRRAFAEDPRCNFCITADCAGTLMELFQEAYDGSGWSQANPALPVIFMSGDDDPCMGGRRRFLEAVDGMRRAGYTDVRWVTYPGMRHEILNEVNKMKVWEDILAFVDSIE